MKSLVIDSGRTMGVARPVWERGKFRLVHPDHYPCLLTRQDLQWKEKGDKKEKKKVCWDLAKSGGWNMYEVLTNKYSEAINNVVEDKTKTIEEVAKKFNKSSTRVLEK